MSPCRRLFYRLCIRIIVFQILFCQHTDRSLENEQSIGDGNLTLVSDVGGVKCLLSEGAAAYHRLKGQQRITYGDFSVQVHVALCGRCKILVFGNCIVKRLAECFEFCGAKIDKLRYGNSASLCILDYVIGASVNSANSLNGFKESLLGSASLVCVFLGYKHHILYLQDALFGLGKMEQVYVVKTVFAVSQKSVGADVGHLDLGSLPFAGRHIDRARELPFHIVLLVPVGYENGVFLFRKNHHLKLRIIFCVVEASGIIGVTVIFSDPCIEGVYNAVLAGIGIGDRLPVYGQNVVFGAVLVAAEVKNIFGVLFAGAKRFDVVGVIASYVVDFKFNIVAIGTRKNGDGGSLFCRPC